MYRAIAANKRNTVLIMIVFVLIIAALASIAWFVYGNWSITIAITIFAIVYAVFQYYAASGEALSMTGAYHVKNRAEATELWDILENLSITEGLPMPKLYVIDDPSPNAFATGRGPKDASVAVTTGLMDILDRTEMEGVLAHELGHVKNYDIRLNMIVFGLVVAIGMIADFLMRLAFFSGLGGNRNSNNNNPAGLILIVFGIIGAIVAPLVAALVQAAVSRQREYLADATGAMTTRYPDGLARALAKIEQAATPSRFQNSSMAHLWFANPLRGGGVSRLFATHPPIPDRIKRLQEMGGQF